MGLAVRIVSALLVVLLALSGGTLDLCTCHGGVHGIFCDEAREAAAACKEASPQGASPAPTPAATAMPCCCREAPPPPVARVVTAPAHAQARDAGCHCPKIAFASCPTEAGPGGSVAPPSAAPQALHLDLALAAPAPSLVAPGVAPWPAWPPGVGARRRHLELHVLRC
jgi:hypothetical protein